MKIDLQNLKKDKVTRVSTGAAFVVLLIFTALIILIQGSLPPLIPLVNNMPWGTERLLEKNMIFTLPLIALIVMTVNTATVALLYDKNILLARIVSFNTLLFNTLALMALIQIILLVL